MHWLSLVWHWIEIHTGTVNESGPYYGFWSGFGSDLGEVTILGAVAVGLKHVNCHDKGCWRIITHKVDGTPFKACRKHHPVLSQHPKITAALMAKMHKEAQTHK